MPALAFAQNVEFRQSSVPAGVINQVSFPALGSQGSTVSAPLSSAGFRFTHWTMNGVRNNNPSGQGANPVKFTVTEPVLAVANFVPELQNSDGDGLPDWWEIHFFGNLSATDTGDPDGDGFTNKTELENGLHPGLRDERLAGGVSRRRGFILNVNVGVTDSAAIYSGLSRRRSPPQLAILNPAYVRLSETSNPAGVLALERMLNKGASVLLSTAPDEFATYRFTGWLVDGVRFDSATQKQPVSVTLTKDTHAVARYMSPALDSDADGIPDWMEWYYFEALNHTLSSDPDDDGVPWNVELFRGYSVAAKDALQPGGISRRRSVAINVDVNANRFDYRFVSDPAGAFDQSGRVVAGTVVTSPDVGSGIYGTFRFGYWEIAGVRQTDPAGNPLPRISIAVTSAMTATARYFRQDVDSDADGVLDWFELAYFGSLDRSGSNDDDGDGMTLTGEFFRGTSPRSNDLLASGGISRRRSETAAVNTVQLTGPPFVAVNGPVDVTPVGVRLNALVNPAGVATTVFFEHGPTLAYGSKTPVQSLGASYVSTAVAAAVTGLEPGSLYYFRVVAENARGTTTSAHFAFSTLWDAAAIEGFEGAGVSRRWQVTAGVWKTGKPAVGPGAAFAGESCAGTGLDANYPAGADSRLVGPLFEIPLTAQMPRLSFQHWWMFGAGDYGAVEIREGTTGPWQSVATFTGSFGEWLEKSVDLSGFAGRRIQVAFRLKSDADTNVGPGWFVDQVQFLTGPITSWAANTQDTFKPEDFWRDWTVTGTIWESGTPTIGPKAGHEGVTCAATVLTGNYPANADSRLVSRFFLVPPANENARLRFWHWYRFGSGDRGVVEVREAGGVWTELLSYAGLGGASWSKPALKLEAYQGKWIQVAFRISANSFGEDDGWYVDQAQIVTGAEVLNNPETFDGDIGDWLVDLAGLWQMGVPIAGPRSAHSGSNVAATNLGGSYPPNSVARLQSPAFQVGDPGPGRLVSLRFWEWHQYGTGDGGSVQIAVLNGSVWSDWSTLMSVSGTSTAWQERVLELTPYIGKTVRLGFLHTANGDGSTGAGWYLDDIEITSLLVGTFAAGSSVSNMFSAGGSRHYYSVTVTGETPLYVTLSSAAVAGTEIGVYLRQGMFPTTGDFDQRAAVLGSAQQRFFVPLVVPGTYYIMVNATVVSSPTDYTLSVSTPTFLVYDVSPGTMSDVLPGELYIKGTGFSATDVVELVGSSGVAVPAASQTLVSLYDWTARFNAGSVVAGTYAVRVRRADGTLSTMPGAVRVVAGGQPKFEAQISVPSQVLYREAATFTVTYRNAGQAAMAAPLLTVRAVQKGQEKAFLTMNEGAINPANITAPSRDAFANKARILACGDTAGVLLPGESKTVPVYYAGWEQPWDLTYPRIEVILEVTRQDEPAVVDWSRIYSILLQTDSAQWASLVARTKAHMGNTWGEVVGKMNALAVQFAALRGSPSRDGNELYELLFRTIPEPETVTTAGAADLSGEAVHSAQSVHVAEAPAPGGAGNPDRAGLFEWTSVPPGSVHMWSGDRWTEIKGKAQIPAGDVVVIIHGLHNSIEKSWVKDMHDAIRARGPQVLAVDWRLHAIPFGPAVPIDPVAAAANAVYAAWRIPDVAATAVRRLFDEETGLGLNPASVHLIGHSHGCHVAGLIGTMLPEVAKAKPGRIRRITLLDASREASHRHPRNPEGQGWDRNAAVFVDNYKTSAISGGRTPWGHNNFILLKDGTIWADPLREIPGSESYNRIHFAHEYAIWWFIDSIRASISENPQRLGFDWNALSWKSAVVPQIANFQPRNSGDWLAVIRGNLREPIASALHVLEAVTVATPQGFREKSPPGPWRYPGTWSGAAPPDQMMEALGKSAELKVESLETAGLLNAGSPASFKFKLTNRGQIRVAARTERIVLPNSRGGGPLPRHRIVVSKRDKDKPALGDLGSGSWRLLDQQSVGGVEATINSNFTVPSEEELKSAFGEPNSEGRWMVRLFAEVAYDARHELYEENNLTSIDVDIGPANDFAVEIADVIATDTDDNGSEVVTLTASAKVDKSKTVTWSWSVPGTAAGEGAQSTLTFLAKVGVHTVTASATVGDLTRTGSAKVVVNPKQRDGSGQSVGGGTIQPIGARDPNDKVASGFGPAGHIRPAQPVSYMIRFENDAEATAPAQDVDIVDPLSTNLDWSSLRLHQVGFGDVRFTVPENSQQFSTSLPFGPEGLRFRVLIDVLFNPSTGRLETAFRSVNPANGLPPSAGLGFLPPEDGTGRGQGFVSYMVSPKPGLAHGTAIRNIASITFDHAETIATNQIDPHDPSKGTDPAKEALVTIDATAPTATVAALPASTGNPSIPLAWSGADSGSGVTSYDIYVRIDGAAWTLWQTNTTATTGTYLGAVDHSYAFFAVARDGSGNAGNAPATGTAPHTQTSVVPPTAPTIATHPIGKTVTVGTTATFAVSANGTGPFTYQWQFSADGNAWSDLAASTTYSGVTSDTLTVNAPTLSMNGHRFRVSVGNVTPTRATSDVASLNVTPVNSAPSFTTQPVALTIPAGGNASFLAVANGFPVPALRWQFSADGVSWTDVPAVSPYGEVTSETLVITAASIGLNTTRYRCLASNSVQSDVPSQVVALTVFGPPAITSAQSVTFTVGRPSVYAIVANAPVTGYTVGALPAGLLFNSTRAEITGAPTSVGTFPVSLRASNAAGVGAEVTLTINVVAAAPPPPPPPPPPPSPPPFGGGGGGGANVAPVITTHPIGQTVMEGTTVTFSVQASGSGLLYVWRRNGTEVPNGRSSTLMLTNVTLAQAGLYSAYVSNSGGFAVSRDALLTVNPAPTVTAPSIDTPPSSQSASVGETVRFTVVARGSEPLTYRWFKDGVPLPPTNQPTLVLNSITLASAGSYTVRVENSAGNATSTPAILTVLPPNFAGSYFGALGNQGTFSLFVRGDGSAVFLGHLRTQRQGLVIRNLQVGSDGRFETTAAPVGAVAAAIHTGTVAAASTDYQIAGIIAEAGTISGTMSGLDIFLTAPAGQRRGRFGNAAGHYVAGVHGGSATSHTIIGAAGAAFVLTLNGATVDSARGEIGETGQFTLTSENEARIAGSLDVAAATIAMVVTAADGSPVSFVGANNDTRAGLEKLANISTRSRAGIGSDSLIAGFVVTGAQAKLVLVRAIGPTLGSFGVAGALSAARLDIFSGPTLVASGSDWGSAPAADSVASTAAAVGAFSLSRTSRDAALLVSLPPGPYTAVASGQGGAAGIALVEVYDAASAGTARTERIINISTRSVAEGGDSTLTAGFVISGTVPKRVLVRGVGPSLAQFGITGVLSRLEVAVYSGNNVVARNTSWSTSMDAASIGVASAEVGAFALLPASQDGALILNLSPGPYTAQVAGIGGATGVALIEVYEIP